MCSEGRIDFLLAIFDHKYHRYAEQIFNGLLQYNSVNTSLNYNLRLSWEYHPLSFIYLVLTAVNDKSRSYTERQFINKISFVRQF